MWWGCELNSTVIAAGCFAKIRYHYIGEGVSHDVLIKHRQHCALDGGCKRMKAETERSPKANRLRTKKSGT